MPVDSNAGFSAILAQAAAEQASDIHLMAGQPPIFRLHGKLKRIDALPVYTKEALLAHLDEALPPELQARYRAERELDTSLVLASGERFRVNAFWEKGNPSVAIRFIPAVIPSMDDLLAPEAAYDFVNMNNGLVCVTGPTGAGKSTLLASMINHINTTRKEHIITLEDPIEFLYTSDQSIIAQREMGSDFLSFPAGLKHVLRQDPNIVLVGEMRDLETISATITLAETGHLVFTTLHTNSASETIDRIVDSFPASQQSQIRLQLAVVLRGIISQILLPRTDETRIAAHEVLVNNVAIA
ncbi:MAG TPA: PilT/PilU family type 4a pilus ATPase, partial [Candidatus Methylomirabilis sp.]|nr:PilT/PilU family type 4a pilus ATPase [Candidatus Methylomirabilis sp.]